MTETNMTDIGALVKEYEESGIKLYTEDRKLKFKAPAGVMTDERKGVLKKYKDMIITYLQFENETVLISDTENRYSIFPLTNIQNAYLMGREGGYKYGGVSCHAYGELILPYTDSERMKEAWHRTILRHDMLRAVVYKEGYQQVLRDAELPELISVFCSSEDEFESTRLKTREMLAFKQYETGKFPMYEIRLTGCADRTVLHFSIDMLIADFPSVNIILTDLMNFYNHPESEPEELQITYRDILLFEQKEKNSGKGREKYLRDKKYWLDRASDFPESPQLPVRLDELDEMENGIIQFSKLLDAQKWNRLKKTAGKYHLTPSAVILSAYGEILSKWSAEDHFAINITRMDRPQIHEQSGMIVGDFTDVIVFEMDYREPSDFMHSSKRIQNQLWRDLEHSSFSGVDFLRELTKQNGSPVIMPVVFTSTVGLANAAEDKKYDLAYEISQTPQVWIDCQVSEREGGVFINWDVRKGIFRDEDISAMFDSLCVLLESAAESDEDQFCSIKASLPEKMLFTRKKVNNTFRETSGKNLLDDFLTNVREYPEKTAAVFESQKYSYIDLYNEGLKYAGELLTMDFGKGELCAVSLPKSFEQIAAVIGILMAGGVYVPVLDSQPVSRKKKIMNSGCIKYCITFDQDIADEGINIIEPGKERNAADGSVIISADPDDTAYIIYTSGSTGIPKGVVITHRSAVNTLEDVNRRLDIGRDDTAIGIAELSFDLSVYDIFGMLAAGGCVVIPSESESRDPEKWIKLIKDNNVTVWNTVPAHMQMLCSMAEYKYDSLGLKNVLLSGDWIPVDLPERIFSIAPEAEIYSLGGATECAVWSVIYRIGKEEKFERSIPYGTPLANQYFRILDGRLNDRPDHVPGELYIGGEGVARGYLNSEEQTEYHFIIHPDTGERLYRTGDYGMYRDDGIIEFLGRRDEQVKLNGHRIELKEIENVISTMEKADHAAAVISRSGKENGISVFVTAAEEDNDEKYLKYDKAVQSCCVRKGDSIASEYDQDLIRKWITCTDTAALLNMTEVFRSKGIFTQDDMAYSIDEAAAALEVQDKYMPLLRRMIYSLEKEEFIRKTEDGKAYLFTDKFSQYDIDAVRKEMNDTETLLKNNRTLTDYLTNDGSMMAQLFSGQTDPLEFIYPKGTVENALSAYRDNIFVKTLNGSATEGILRIVQDALKESNGRPVRILEPGAGVGGTSRDLIPLLDRYKVEYHFTDISAFFLNEARKTFSDHNWIKYQIFDINKNYREQNYGENMFDIIICANVLHNAADGGKTLKMLSEMLTPNGYLVIIDCVSESYSLMTSMSFEYTMKLTDYRNEESAVYFTYPHWIENFENAGLKMVCDYPDEGSPVGMSGQHLFVLRKQSEKVKLSPEEVTDHCRSNLPDYMVPSYAEIITAMPLTANGKINRKELEERSVSSVNVKETAGEKPQGITENKLAEVWKSVLGTENIGRNDNFYALGGDSLLVTQLVVRMKDEIPEMASMEWNDILSAVAENPTVEKLAAFIESGKKTVHERDPYEIICGPEGSCSSEIVLFADGTGTTGIYNDIIPELRKYIKEKVRLSSIRVNDTEHYLSVSSDELISVLGHEYSEMLVRNRAEKYYLVGHCFGGLAALETARELERNGIDAEVIMIDSRLCDSFERNELLLERGFGMLLRSDVSVAGNSSDEELLREAIEEFRHREGVFPSENDLCSLSGKYDELGREFRALSEIPHRERMKRAGGSILGRTGEISEFELEFLMKYYSVFCHSYESVSKYRPERFDGKLTLLRCEDQAMSFLPVYGTESSSFVSGITNGKADIIEINGDHVSCMYGENGINVSRLIRSSTGEKCFG